MVLFVAAWQEANLHPGDAFLPSPALAGLTFTEEMTFPGKSTGKNDRLWKHLDEDKQNFYANSNPKFHE